MAKEPVGPRQWVFTVGATRTTVTAEHWFQARSEAAVKLGCEPGELTWEGRRMLEGYGVA